MKKLILTAAILSSTTGVLARATSEAEKHAINVQENQKAQVVNKGGPAFYTVGDTNDCDFRLGTTKIQDALDDALTFGVPEVRVAIGTYQENLTINDYSVTLKGGYADCAAAVADNQTGLPSATVIEAATADPVVLITGNTQRNVITLDTVQLTGGTGQGFAAGGGLTSLNSDASLNLNNVWIDFNTGILGGGISLILGDTDLVAFNLMVASNTADEGGGIYCDGSGTSSVFIDGEANNGYGIFNNQATSGNGGGVALVSGCNFTSYVGTSGGFLDLKGIQGNSATENGGGIYAASGSTVNLNGAQFCFFGCNGYNEEPVLVAGNEANSDDVDGGFGGGIYATGSGTRVNFTNALIVNNDADQGGGMYLADLAEATGGIVTTDLFGNSIECWSPGSCNQVNENTALTTGGAFRLDTGATADLNRTHIQGNRANFGTAVYALAADTSFEGEGLLVTGNGDNGADGFSDNNVFRLLSGATINLSWSTVADNNINNDDEIIDNGSSSLRLQSSIVHENNPVNIYDSSSPVVGVFDCMIVHEDTSIVGTTFGITVDDPEFIDRANGDYHINPNTSPAVDYCDDFNAPEFSDSDGDERGFDWSNISDNFGSFDVGYDEQTDIIFKNGFETAGGIL
ncbi:hypothetical protein OS175_02340 [Marinicella sp. S1101]|uniref:hypothetical protein n=1 Tax=Marinicella marina TaxID=2996016 RepID=UPI002260BCFC|nr:hypothetical protein [Marinicella marina]MCX7552705.1 hypothetical protein [Marinicella marina]MDJ1139986.1 hypothetical protein [Marinicella marina]